MIGQEKGDNKEYTLDKVKEIEVLDKVWSRILNFNGDECKCIPVTTNMFAEHPAENLTIAEGEELVGFAVAVDDNGYPNWVDFVVTAGGQWQYQEGKTCEQYHALNKFMTTAKLPESDE